MSGPIHCWCHEFISTITVLVCFWGRVPVMVFRFQVYYALQIACHYSEFPSECTSRKCILPELPPCQERTRVSWGGRTIPTDIYDVTDVEHLLEVMSYTKIKCMHGFLQLIT